ncbi:CaiB/BaiF CoA-transferase family protein [Paenibacillus sp. GP183]|uniref:CaiB/BaiF CoA transferase family protein n=1 Tax=Paenibacillus sp. GP183 TaxID=1882751 RepID=UPI000899FA88|nr:CaiB/BaiF CoA-transferase family protein [Paenibacillus sp. GP183]SED06380.1 Crotonobetainyl-CoA:carnitine CoA-transferase CaiB [Paenibacillus sp. GP183]
MLPLQGITVVSLEQAIAAPFATRQLADLGARVIKIERPEFGDFARVYDTTVNGLSSHFVWTNRSKESLTLDLKKPEGKEILHRLLAEADVFVQNLAPGAVDRLGFGPSKLNELFPRLIVCGISGYGSSGPYWDKKAYDLLIQCESGLVAITGTEETPSKAGIPVADIAAGMYAYSGILTALIARGQTGKGVVMDVSMLEALGEWMGFPLYYASYGGSDPKRTGASHATIYPYGPFSTGDQKLVFFAIQNEREWENFCHNVLENSELITDDRFSGNLNRLNQKEILKNLIDEVFQRFSAAELIGRLEAAQIANATLNTPMEFFEHPQLKARNRWREVDTPVGKVRALLPPVTMEEMDWVMAPVPAVGEHTASILSELGFGPEIIENYKQDKVI